MEELLAPRLRRSECKQLANGLVSDHDAGQTIATAVKHRALLTRVLRSHPGHGCRSAHLMVPDDAANRTKFEEDQIGQTAYPTQANACPYERSRSLVRWLGIFQDHKRRTFCPRHHVYGVRSCPARARDHESGARQRAERPYRARGKTLTVFVGSTLSKIRL